MTPKDLRISNFIDALKAVGIDLKEPNIQEVVQSIIFDILEVDTEAWLTLVQRAEQLGYTFQNQADRTRINSYMSVWREEKGLKLKRGDNLTSLYLVNKKLDSAIQEYFGVDG